MDSLLSDFSLAVEFCLPSWRGLNGEDDSVPFQVFGGIFRCYAVLFSRFVGVVQTEWEFIMMFWQVCFLRPVSATRFGSWYIRVGCDCWDYWAWLGTSSLPLLITECYVICNCVRFDSWGHCLHSEEPAVLSVLPFPVLIKCVWVGLVWHVINFSCVLI
jgi:hypothetical protein